MGKCDSEKSGTNDEIIKFGGCCLHQNLVVRYVKKKWFSFANLETPRHNSKDLQRKSFHNLRNHHLKKKVFDLTVSHEKYILENQR